MLFKIIGCIILGYFFGCVQTGFIYGKMHGIDIRNHGSGNSGTTNVLRTLGKKAGYITYAGDALKALVAIYLVKYLLFRGAGDATAILAVYTGLGVVLGHNYPFYLNFKGGKGIAVTSAVMFAVDWRFALIGGICFFIVFQLFRYVSLGSLVLTFLFPVCCLIFYFGNWHLFILSVIFMALAWWRHRTNIVRLLNGTENGFERKKKK